MHSELKPLQSFGKALGWGQGLQQNRCWRPKKSEQIVGSMFLKPCPPLVGNPSVFFSTWPAAQVRFNNYDHNVATFFILMIRKKYAPCFVLDTRLGNFQAQSSHNITYMRSLPWTTHTQGQDIEVLKPKMLLNWLETLPASIQKQG